MAIIVQLPLLPSDIRNLDEAICGAMINLELIDMPDDKRQAKLKSLCAMHDMLNTKFLLDNKTR